ncbi:hypothetical protein [Rhodoplanes roseus]|uniref:Uncharacterized protein n=1 Tax=Rhodoplanes roseus TaxID=29409 RepID=A0A327L4L0_9BRAD|nr:hypothetical protein [Rhodoplanes roseus]RAI45990.1 hypothetical protein CH341_01370 [Rhodoplanes roseus]
MEIPEHIRAELGTSEVAPGVGKALLERAAEAIAPRDAIDRLLLDEAVTYTRLVRIYERGLGTFPDDDYAAVLEEYLIAGLEEPLTPQAARDLVLQCLAGDHAAVVRLEELLALGGTSLDKMHGEAFRHFCRKRPLREQNERHRARRDVAVEDFASRRGEPAHRVQATLDSVVDHELDRAAQLSRWED